MSHDIYKASDVTIRDRKVLVERSFGNQFFIHPGGKIEPDETRKQVLVRELKEELTIDVDEADLEPFDKNTASAANSPGVDLHLEAFIVKH
jgi:8-oxo-dGTP diphosphatase